MIELKNVTKIFGEKENRFVALRNVNLTIANNSTVAIVGKSGSGKSTMMHVMSGLDHPTEGNITIDGDDIFSLKQKQIDQFRSAKIGFIFQSFFVQGNETCYDNVSLPLEIAKVPRAQRRAKIEAALGSVDLGEKIYSRAKDLSGGQKQRLAIARAIVNEPTILFADEPTGNLDSATSEVVENLLFSYAENHKATLIIVTHDHDLADKCDQQVHIKDGKIVKEAMKK